MMWKKILYGGLLLIVVYFIYTIFFKQINTPVAQMEKEMKAKNVVYRLKDDAIIYADEQIGSTNDKIIKFKGVTIDLLKKEILIKGKEAEVNTETSDVTLIGEVVGRTKDNKWSLFTEQVDYKKEGDKLISKTRTTVKNEQDKMEFIGDEVETTTKFEEIFGKGNVYLKRDNRILESNTIKYNDVNKIAEAEGNIRYKDTENNITADKAIYYMEKKQVDATGHVVYNSKDKRMTADHVFYDEIKKQTEGTGNVVYTDLRYTIRANHMFYDEITKIINADGNGSFVYKERNSTGTFNQGVYDLGNETFTTNSVYTINYEDYKMSGTDMFYQFKTGDTTFNRAFSITKQNFTVKGSDGRMNTLVKNIFANNMEMTSAQGDKITSRTGEGSFEKKEFKFNGNINGKIRGNVKNFMTNPQKLVEAEAIKFKANNGKIYFISHNNNDMSITRSEMKENVHMTYKELVLDSQYNEIDTSKNLVMVRDKIIVDLRDEIQMTSNFLYYNLNSEEGTAQNNVKISGKSLKAKNLNMSSEKAMLNMSKQKVELIGNVVSYQGKNRITSEKATYYFDKRTLENSGNIKMQYQIGSENVAQTKSDSKNVEAIAEILNKIHINQNEINNNMKINLPKTMKATNGVLVSLRWIINNSTYISANGNLNKPYYKGSSKNVTLKVVATSGADIGERQINVIVPVENVREMLARASKNVNSNNKVSSINVNIFKEILNIPVVWEGNTAVLKYNGVEYKK